MRWPRTTTTIATGKRPQDAREPIAALNRVRIAETGEPLADIRERCPGVVVSPTTCPYLRVSVADRLTAAAEALPAGYRFRVGTALRTLRMQQRGYDRYYAQMQQEHPGWPRSALRRATNRFFAPYDQPAPPGHTTGGAVDVTLLGKDDEPVDVSSPLEGWAAAPTWLESLAPDARARRMILVESMLGAGFSNCRDEYWHYSWGDSAWAVRTGQSECPYGLVEPPPRVECNYEGGAAASIEPVGEHAWRLAATESGVGPRLHAGVFWQAGKQVTLFFTDLHRADLFLSADRKEWVPLPLASGGGGLVARFEPADDRVYVATHPDPPNPEASS